MSTKIRLLILAVLLTISFTAAVSAAFPATVKVTPPVVEMGTFYGGTKLRVEGRVVADFGCGNGILGIGALLLGAKQVYFVEKDHDVVEIMKENLMDVRVNRLSLNDVFSRLAKKK